MASTGTLEQRVKCGAGLPIGMHLVALTHVDQMRTALVEISPRGKVSLLMEPQAEDMYSCWVTVKGDNIRNEGAVIVWGARDPALKARFAGPPRAVLPVRC